MTPTRLFLLVAFALAALVLGACGVEHQCHGGCLCFSVASCPSGCFVAQGALADGGSGAFCANGSPDGG
jgi:hypothetical protein